LVNQSPVEGDDNNTRTDGAQTTAQAASSSLPTFEQLVEEFGSEALSGHDPISSSTSSQQQVTQVPNAQPANLIEPAVPTSNVTNPHVPNTLSTQYRQSDDRGEMQVARDNLSHASASGVFDSELADKRRNGHGHPDAVAQQPTSGPQIPQSLRQTFRDNDLKATVDWNDRQGYFPNGNPESAGADPVDTTTTGGGYQPGHASQHALGPALTIPQGPVPYATGGWIVDGAGEAPFDAQSDEVLSARKILADWQSSKGETFEHKRDENMLTDEVAAELHGLVGHFSSQQAREDYLDTHDQTWKPPRGDDTIPKSEEDMKKIVTDLVFAMSSTEFAADSEANNALKTRWLPGKLFYKKEKIVLRCWQLAEIAKRLHEEGPSALYCFDDRYSRSEFAKTQSWTFQERMDVMINLLATRKSRCDALMKGDQIDVFVGAPGKLLKTATQNAPNNAKKGEALKRGREAIKDEEDKAATSQTAKKPASTSQPASTSWPATIPAQNLSGHQVAASARTTNTGTRGLWGDTGATSRTDSRGFVQHPKSYGTPHGDPGRSVSLTRASPPYQFPVDGRTQGSNSRQPSFPGVPSMLSQKRPAVDDLNDATQKRQCVPPPFDAGPLPQQVDKLHYSRQNATRSLPANIQTNYTSSGQVPVDPQILQPPPQAQHPRDVQQPRVPSSAPSPTVHPSASSSAAHTSGSLKRGPTGNIQDPAGYKRMRQQ
jgi:hypothetical protein